MEITKHLSLAVMGVSECFVSIARIQRFLETPELEKRNAPLPLLENDDSNAAIIASKVTCHWNSSGRNSRALTTASSASNSINDIHNDVEMKHMESFGLILALDDISVEFDRGTLTCIIGAVGSGKSALIQMLAGELPLSDGDIRRQDCSVAYAPQDPWIMDGTIKDNILFGLSFNSELYSSVIKACGLDVDFLQLRQGENAIVGDRGVQLSGGQRARIALARAFYRDSDIILLDDPLSAVDSRVGRLLFYSAIHDLGLKKGKCVILVTHQHQFIGDHRCIMMSAGRVTCIGSYQQCVEASDGKLTFAAQNQSTDNLTKLDKPQDQTIKEEEKTKPKEVTKVDEELEGSSNEANDHKEQSSKLWYCIISFANLILVLIK